jgi:hypothetical protein
MPNCIPVHGKVQPGRPMHCHDLGKEHRAQAEAMGRGAVEGVERSHRGRKRKYTDEEHTDKPGVPCKPANCPKLGMANPLYHLGRRHVNWRKQTSSGSAILAHRISARKSDAKHK